MNDFVMSYDERVVRERIGVVRDLLQAQRVRQGALAADANAPLRLALASFVDRARSEGWTRAFDEVLTAAQKAASDGSETAKISKIVEYLVEVEPYIVRLAQTKRSTNTSEENVATTNAVLRASTGGVPALHRMQGFGTASLSERWAPDFVEPGALIQLHALSRDVLDELASLALLRAPGLDEPWTIGAGFEERLLNMLDAGVALSRGAISLDIVRAARSRAEASPVAEPYRWFVPTFLLACTDGERAMDALRETLLEAPEGMFEGLVDAVCLGSNPDRATIAMSLLDEDDRPEILCGALDILVRLGKPIEGRLVELVEHPNLDVATRAAMAVSLTVDTQSAVRTLRPLLAEDDRSTFIACVLTTIAPEIGAPHLREVVRRGTKEGASEVETDQAVQAAEILAALGQTRDSQQLIALAGVSDDACRALATLGTPEALEFLRASPPQPPLQLRADGAAWRGGAGTLVPPLHVALQSNAELERGLGGEARKAIRSPFNAVRALERITGLLEEDEPTAEGRARAREKWLHDVLAFVVPKGASRVRLGQAFSPSVILDELHHPGTHVRTRRTLVQEARILGARPIPIDLEGWLAPQRSWLDLAKNAGWPGPTRRS